MLIGIGKRGYIKIKDKMKRFQEKVNLYALLVIIIISECY